MTRPHSCSAPLAEDRIVAYWANELGADEVGAVDDQVFACDGCAADVERLSKIVQVFRAAIPPVVSRDEVETMRARGHVIRDNTFSPGERQSVVFDRDAELLIHHLAGLDLADAERVEVFVRSETAGPMFAEPFAPFDRERGEVLIACQRHFAAMPADVAFDVRVHHRSSASPALVTYFVPHEFAR